MEKAKKSTKSKKNIPKQITKKKIAKSSPSIKNIEDHIEKKKKILSLKKSVWLLIALLFIAVATISYKSLKWQEVIGYYFIVRRIEVIGVSDIFVPSVLAAAQNTVGKPIGDISMVNVLRRIKELPFVYDVSVHRVLPNKLEIHIIERHPSIIWQDDSNQYHILNDRRQIIAKGFPKDRQGRIVVLRGKQALEKVYVLLSYLAYDMEIFRKIDVVSDTGVSWTVLLASGIVIKLPEDNVFDAWKKLISYHKKTQVLDREVAQIDLRIPGKMIIQPRQIP